MKLVTQHFAKQHQTICDWSLVRHVASQSTNMADSVEKSTISEKEVTEDSEVALEKKLSEVKNWS